MELTKCGRAGEYETKDGKFRIFKNEMTGMWQIACIVERDLYSDGFWLKRDAVAALPAYYAALKS